MTPEDRAQRRLQQLAQLIEPDLRDAFLRMARTLTVRDLTELIRRLESGDAEGAVSLLFDRPDVIAAQRAVRATWARSLIDLARRATRDLTRELRITVAAPVASPAIIGAVRRWEDAAFARVLAEVREGLRETIAQELARGLGPRQVAVALKGAIGSGGLTAYDAKIIASFRKALEEGRYKDALGRMLRDKRFDKTLAKMGKLSSAQIEKMVAAYRRKLIAWRAETFARTAAIQAANEATAASWQEAVASGVVPLAEVRRYWVVAEDERTCPVCQGIADAHQQGVGLNDPFGTFQSPPAHPNCRCTVWIRRERAGVARRPTPGSARLILPPFERSAA